MMEGVIELFEAQGTIPQVPKHYQIEAIKEKGEPFPEGSRTRKKYTELASEARQMRSDNWDERKKLESSLRAQMAKSLYENFIVQGILSQMNDTVFTKREDRFLFWDRNKHIVQHRDREGLKLGLDNEEDYTYMNKAFDLLPSTYNNNVMYAVPKDPLTAIELRYVLQGFNERFPDTSHIKGSEDNFFPYSLIKGEFDLDFKI